MQKGITKAKLKRIRFPLFLLCCVFLISCRQGHPPLTKITATTLAADSTVLSTSEIDSIIHPYKEKLSVAMQRVLGYSPKDLVRTDGAMQSSLGNLMADMCFDQGNPIFNEMSGGNIDFAMFNYGGIRAGIPKGEVVTSHAFSLMPFENELVVATLSGNKVGELIDFFIENKLGHPLSKHISLTIRKNDYDLQINGKRFSADSTYTVLTSDYLQNGGDKMNFFKAPIKLTKLDVKVRDAILTHFKKMDTLRGNLDNRVMLEP